MHRRAALRVRFGLAQYFARDGCNVAVTEEEEPAEIDEWIPLPQPK
jgi:hypothetical protein